MFAIHLVWIIGLLAFSGVLVAIAVGVVLLVIRATGPNRMAGPPPGGTPPDPPAAG